MCPFRNFQLDENNAPHEVALKGALETSTDTECNRFISTYEEKLSEV